MYRMPNFYKYGVRDHYTNDRLHSQKQFLKSGNSQKIVFIDIFIHQYEIAPAFYRKSIIFSSKKAFLSREVLLKAFIFCHLSGCE